MFGCIINLLIISIFSRFLRSKTLGYVILLNLFISLISSIYIIYDVIFLETVNLIPLFVLLHVGWLKLKIALLFDCLSAVMLFIVIFISFLVHLYSLDYLEDDPHLFRFLFFLSLFTFFMIFLVTSSNFFQTFIGWEGVGLSSYLLINFWFTRSEANKSAIKAMVVNRVGDFGIYFSLLLCYFVFKSVDYGFMFALAPVYKDAIFIFFGYEIPVFETITFFLFIGIMGKSAQLGLHMWLPDAMEGPTPVSALLHAATMVTAGVFILLRFSLFFDYAPKVLIFVAIIGSLTSLFAGVAALIQYDIKKIIAYSTCSHLGIMILCCGLSQYQLALFHLVNHAFFKALLFLSSGSLIHAFADEQDVRKFGGLVYALPFTYCMFQVGSLSLIGFPFLSGFYSKDFIWETIVTNDFMLYNWDYNFPFLDIPFPLLFFKYLILIINLIFILSVSYSFRLIFIVFAFDYKGYKSLINYSHEPSLFMFLPLLVLSFFSIFFGHFSKDLFIGDGSNVIWSGSMPSTSVNSLATEYLFFNNLSLNLATLVLTVIIIRYLYIYYKKLFNPSSRMSVCSWYVNNVFIHIFVFLYFCILKILGKPLKVLKYESILDYLIRFFSNKFIFKKVYTVFFSDHFFYKYISKFFLFLSYHVTFKSIDRGFLEHFGPFGLTNFLSKIGKFIAWRFYTHFYSFVFSSIFLGIFFFFLYFCFPEEEFLIPFFVFVTLISCFRDKK